MTARYAWAGGESTPLRNPQCDPPCRGQLQHDSEARALALTMEGAWPVPGSVAAPTSQTYGGVPAQRKYRIGAWRQSCRCEDHSADRVGVSERQSGIHAQSNSVPQAADLVNESGVDA
jgi:hypothetical protein